MASLFNLLTVIVTKLYPIFASSKAYIEYEKANNVYNSGNFTIGGINVPINTLLKKASGDSEPVPDEAVVLVYQSNKLHKWLIFWIVSCSFEMLSTILLFKYIIPLYSLFRLGVSLWFLFPLLKPVSQIEYNSQQDLNGFFNSGCGFCFKQATNYFSGSSNTVQLQDVGVDVKQIEHLIDRLVALLVDKFPILGILIKFSGTRGVPNEQDPNDEAASPPSTEYVESLKNYGAFKFQEFFAAKRTDEVEDYDVVEPPVSDSTGTDETNEQTPRKRGWVW